MSIVRLFWYLHVVTRISLSEIEFEFDKLLEQAQMSERNVVDVRTDERQDMTKELLGVVSARANVMLSTSRMAPRGGKLGTEFGMNSFRRHFPPSHSRVW